MSRLRDRQTGQKLPARADGVEPGHEGRGAVEDEALRAVEELFGLGADGAVDKENGIASWVVVPFFFVVLFVFRGDVDGTIGGEEKFVDVLA